MTATANALRKALTTNSTATSFTAKNATTTKPSGAGIFDLLAVDVNVSSQGMAKFIQLIPFGTNGDNDTFDMQLWGWSKTTDTTPVWVPQLLVELNVVLCAATQGEADTYLADTLTIAKGDADASKISPAGTSNFVASILVHLRGCELIEFEFDLAGGQEAVSCNSYWRLVDQS